MIISKEERTAMRDTCNGVISKGYRGADLEVAKCIIRLLDALESTEQVAAEFEGQAERYSQEFACAERRAQQAEAERDALVSYLIDAHVGSGCAVCPVTPSCRTDMTSVQCRKKVRAWAACQQAHEEA